MSERTRILDLLAEGRITVDEAEGLLQALRAEAAAEPDAEPDAERGPDADPEGERGTPRDDSPFEFHGRFDLGPDLASLRQLKGALGRLKNDLVHGIRPQAKEHRS